MSVIIDKDTRKTFIDSVCTGAERLQKSGLEELIRERKWGKEFEELDGAFYLSSCLELLTSFDRTDVSKLPIETMSKITNLQGGFTALIQKIEQFTGAGRIMQFNSPETEGWWKRFLREELPKYYSSLFDELHSIKLFSSTPNAIIERYDKYSNELNEGIERAKQVKLKIASEEEKVITKINDMVTNIGARIYTKIFKSQSDYHEKKAFQWLLALTVSCVGLAGFIYYSLGQMEVSVDTQEYVHEFMLRAVLISFSFYLLHLFSKNYQAHQHLFVVNKHRQNALGTFEAFIDAAHDPTVKDAVLLQATKAIFEPTISGYISKEPLSSPIPGIDLFKSVPKG